MSNGFTSGIGPEPGYRLATAGDIPTLAPMINRAFAIEQFVEGTRTDPERLARTMEQGQLLVAEREPGRPMGCLYMEPRGERGYLGMLAVEPAWQRAGLAQRLTDEACRRLKELGCIAIDIAVLSQRPELLPIYRRWGFKETAREPFSFARQLKPGVECEIIRMEKPLG